MNPSIKRLLGALLLIGTLGVSAVLAATASASGQTPAPYTTDALSVPGESVHG